MFDLRQKKKLELLSQILNGNVNAAEVAKSRSASALQICSTQGIKNPVN